MSPMLAGVETAWKSAVEALQQSSLPTAPSPPAAPSAPTTATTARRLTQPIPVEAWVPDPAGGIDRVVHRSGRGGVRSDDPVVLEAVRNAQQVLRYFEREFGRRGIDGNGTVLRLRVHASDPYTGEPRSSNAYWFADEQRIWLGSGDGKEFAPLGGAKDVIAHEFAHGVIDHEVKLRYAGQEGALHEHFADVLATGVDGNWQIGEDVYTPGIPGDAIRDLSKLRYRDWRSFPAWENQVHAMSEVPSHAAYLVGQAIGQQALRQIWYRAVVDHLPDGAGFAAARQATLAAALALHGEGSREFGAVRDAWNAVGILDNTPKERPLLAGAAAVDITAITARAAALTSRAQS